MSFILPILLTLFFSSPQKVLVYENRVYEPEIKSVQLYSEKREIRSHLLPSVTQINQNDLVLEFDDLRNDFNSYYVRIIHCQYDWAASSLRDLDFMADYNEFNVNDYAFSSNTQIPYVHYRFNLPKVKLPGNYLLVVYRNGNKSDIILSHRFMVYDGRTSLKQDNRTSGALTLRSTNQQLNFTVDYRGVEIINPFGSVHVVIRQNQRWDNARFNIKPSFVREDVNQIEYRLFDSDKFFTAGNEFRFVDFRSINFPGQNTDRVDKASVPYHLWVQPDASRINEVYSQYPDINGQYYIENRENGNDETASNYVDVTFTLKTQELEKANVYLVGAFNQWIKNQESRMQYSPATGTYQNTQLLKQGWYNYQYQVEGNQLSPNYFEGSHFETENFYEVFFYYRPFQPNADLLIGYFPIEVNAR
ncbi:MAG: DUF5103 domain-containing protein [Cyclobacteriaceae bacterium]|nr:DUF5103 domain-containing protein [Cyclobacteriaceae bacterium]